MGNQSSKLCQLLSGLLHDRPDYNVQYPMPAKNVSCEIILAPQGATAVKFFLFLQTYFHRRKLLDPEVLSGSLQ